MIDGDLIDDPLPPEGRRPYVTPSLYAPKGRRLQNAANWIPTEESPLPQRVLDHGYSEMAEQLQVYKIFAADLLRCLGVKQHVVPRGRQTIPATSWDMDEQDGLVLKVGEGMGS